MENGKKQYLKKVDETNVLINRSRVSNSVSACVSKSVPYSVIIRICSNVNSSVTSIVNRRIRSNITGIVKTSTQSMRILTAR